MLVSWQVKFFIQDRVSRGVLVDIGSPMPDPLTGEKDWQFNMEFDLAHLEGCRVPATHKIADEIAVFRGVDFVPRPYDTRAAWTIGAVVAHVVNHSHEAVVEHGEGARKELSIAATVARRVSKTASRASFGRERLRSMGGELGSWAKSGKRGLHRLGVVSEPAEEVGSDLADTERLKPGCKVLVRPDTTLLQRSRQKDFKYDVVFAHAVLDQ